MNRSERRRRGKLRRQGRRAGSAAFPDGGDAGSFISATLRQAVTFLQTGQPKEALRLYRDILRIHPDHAEALNLGGVATFQLGNARRGLKLIRSAIENQPDYVEAHNNLGNVLRAAGDLDEAQAAYRRALEIEPGYVDAHYNMGVVLEAMGSTVDAARAYDRALEINPDFVDACLNRGNVLRAAGRLDEAIAAYRRTLEIRPDHADAHNNLGSALRELGKLDEAEDAYRRALAISRDHVDAHYNLGVVLQELERFDDAIAAYGKALDISPDFVGAHINLGYALQKLGRLDDAVTTLRRAAQVAPHHAGAHVNLGDALLEQGDASAAAEVCEAYLGAHPGDCAMLAFKAFVLGELDACEAGRELVDFERFIRPVRIGIPESYSSLADFNSALAEHILAHPTLVDAPTSHATRFGRHSGELLVEPKGPVAHLEAMIRDAAEDYRRAPPGDAAHPFVAKAPRRFGLTAWSIVLEAQGHQIPHIHPSAWLSGVYYVKLPGVIAEPDQRGAGWIEFGRPPEHFHAAVEPEIKAFKPEEGLMLMFPSYFYHHTVPFETAETRISIAFDVLPED